MRLKRVWTASAAVLLFAACGNNADRLYTTFMAAGTEVSVTLYEPVEAGRHASLAAVETAMLQRSIDWYPWADGELSALNTALAAGSDIRVSAPLARVLERAADLERRTDGRFNAGLGALTELWGFHRIDEPPLDVPAASDIDALIRSGAGLQNLRDGDYSAVARSTMVDLGGIAKGSMLNEGAAILAAAGIENAIVNLGGDLLVLGRPPGRDARIGIRSPFDSSVAFGVSVQPGEAVMTSGNYERFFDIDGVRYHHILDPATGYPVTHTASVTVIHPDAELADAAATALLVAGPDGFLDLCSALDIEYAVLFSADGDLVLTSALDERLD